MRVFFRLSVIKKKKKEDKNNTSVSNDTSVIVLRSRLNIECDLEIT